MNPDQLIKQLSRRIVSIDLPHPVRIAIDGIDAAGKTTFAGLLSNALMDSGRPILRASLDDFHRPRADRYRLGKDSPEGFYYESFDYPALVSTLLRPLGPGGNRRIRLAIFDYPNDRPVEAPYLAVPSDSILLFDGIFLLRPALREYWDFTIFLDIPFKTSILRGVARDIEKFGSENETRKRYKKRYVPGQKLYLTESDPKMIANVVIKYNHPEKPVVMKIRK